MGAQLVSAVRSACVLVRSPQLQRFSTEPLDWPAFVISLNRRADRTKNALDFLAAVGWSNITVVEAIDGQHLVKAQGRQRLLRHSVRFTWTGAGNTRQCCKLRVGRGLRQSLKDGSVHSWSVLACAMSHHKALKLAQAAFADSGADGCWIFEDDVSLPNALSPQQAAAAVSGMTQAMHTACPTWRCLQLGGSRVDRFAHKTRNGPTDVAGLHVAEVVYQAHAYLVNRTSCDEALAKLCSGGEFRVADCALVALQTLGCCFHCHPPVITQGQQGSDLQVASDAGGQRGWNAVAAARKSKKLTNKRKPSVSNSKPMSAAMRSQVQAMNGQRGGIRRAGSGSTTAAVKIKEAAMRKHFKRHGQWPSQRAARNLGVSPNLRARIMAMAEI